MVYKLPIVHGSSVARYRRRGDIPNDEKKLIFVVFDAPLGRS
jgi:hypothetical protein